MKLKKQEGGFLDVFREFECFNARKYVDWERYHEDTMWVICIKNFSSSPSFEQCQTQQDINYKPRFHSVYSRDYLSRIKDGMYVINLDGQTRQGTHWVSLFINRNTAVYFLILLEFNIFLKKYQPLTHNIFRIQFHGSIICVFYCITLIIARKKLLDYTNLFSPNDYQKNDKIIYK